MKNIFVHNLRKEVLNDAMICHKKDHLTAGGHMPDTITDVDIAVAMKDKYKDYAIKVVVSRALADVRDGLKPVHRRIIYGMFTWGYDWTKTHSKSARIVGDVMGRLHPHGDSSIYEAMARLAQSWSLSVPLIDGQGNFGSPDGDNPAAMRYTESKLAGLSKYLVDGLKENTVDFQPNYDEREEEPVVLPAAFPNVLVNGGSGIAVGMASSMPTHNLGEVLDAVEMRMSDPSCSLEDLMTVLPAPDFPTYGRIMGVEGVKRGYETGRGTLTLEATVTPDKDGRTPILVYTDIPWGVSKTDLLARIKALVESGGAGDVVTARDESARDVVRFVVDMKQGADPERVDAFLKSHTDLRITVPINMTLLDQYGVPREMSLIEILDAWIEFRRTTIRRRLNNELRLLRDRGRLLLGRIAALSLLDKIIKLIRDSENRSSAHSALTNLTFPTASFAEFIETFGTKEQKTAKKFGLSSEQADHILEMRLQRLTGMERDELAKDCDNIIARMREIRSILVSDERVDEIILTELRTIKAAYSQPRRSEIAGEPVVASRSKIVVPAVKLEKMNVLVDIAGNLIKAGKGEPPSHLHSITMDTHSRLVAFMKDGRSFSVGPQDLPAADAKEPFRSLTGILGFKVDGEVAAYLPLNPDVDKDITLCFVSHDGAVRRTSASEFFRIPQPGKSAMNLTDEDPRLLTVFKETSAEVGVFMGSSQGKFIRFALPDVRVMAGRGSRGVRGFALAPDDEVVSAFEVPMSTLNSEGCDAAEASWLGKGKNNSLTGPEILQVSVSGFAKRTIEAAYKQTGRANKGTNDRGPAKGIGKIHVWARIGDEQEHVNLLSPSGQLVHLAVDEVKKTARASSGAVIAQLK